MYKKLVGMIASIETREDFNKASGEIDRAFQSEKITWKDNETLYKLMQKISDLMNS